jgi:prepilin signal peptidase PulO-like enzyme (type II secretory pathway)
MCIIPHNPNISAFTPGLLSGRIVFLKGVFSIEIIYGCLLPSTYSAYTDATKRYLYDYITIPVFLLGLGYSIYTGALTNILTAGIVFTILFSLALKGGIAGGDVKFSTALAVWFGCPNMIYIIGLGSLMGFIWGAGSLAKKGIFLNHMIVFFRGLFYKFFCKVDALPKNDLSEDSVPFGTFLVIAAWIIFFIQRGVAC